MNVQHLFILDTFYMSRLFFFFQMKKLYNLKYSYNYIAHVLKSNNNIQHDQLNYLHVLNQPQTFNQTTNKLHIYHCTYIYSWSLQYTYNIKHIYIVLLQNELWTLFLIIKPKLYVIISVVHKNHIILKSYSQLSCRSSMYFSWVKYSMHNSSTRSCCFLSLVDVPNI